MNTSTKTYSIDVSRLCILVDNKVYNQSTTAVIDKTIIQFYSYGIVLAMTLFLLGVKLFLDIPNERAGNVPFDR
jgi:hypothetical protein